jgi:hypothetical protein
MTALTRSAPVSALASQFNDFLFASIGEERNGMLLSVVSALARLNVDPWQEAANLAQLPVTTAARRLASLIAALPDRPSTHLDPGANAARLIAHLPRRIGLSTPSAEAPRSVNIRSVSVPVVMQSQAFRYAAFILMIVVFGGLGIAASQRSATWVNSADAPASSTVPTQSPTSGQ